MIGQGFESSEVHLRAWLYPGYLTGDLGSVPIHTEVAFGATAECASLRLVASSDRIKIGSQYLKQIVDYPTDQPAGTVVVDPQSRFLYLVKENGKAVRYGVGVGKAGFEFAGSAHIGFKREWPRWTPTPDMLARDPKRYGKWADGMDGSDRNPLGARARVLGEYRHIVAGTVFAYGGTVDKFIGDGVMALFGQPKPKADDAQRALACALSLTAALDEWRNDNIGRGGPCLDAGIGLHYGTVLGGVIESGFHDEFTVIGDAVNVAQRLESLASLLKSPLVVSEQMIEEVPNMFGANDWVYANSVSIPGRKASPTFVALPI